MALDTDMILGSFHCAGNMPDDRGQLKMVATGCANSGVNSFKMRVGIPSGPGALKVPRLSSFLKTNPSGQSGTDLNLGPPGYKSGALTTRPRRLNLLVLHLESWVPSGAKVLFPFSCHF